MADAGYTVEITPAGINAEAPVGTFGDQDKAEDLVKGLVMNLYPDVREDQVAVFLNTDTAVEDGESFSDSIRGKLVRDAMILVNGMWYAVDDVTEDKVFASDDDGGDHEFHIDDIESVDTSGMEAITGMENAEETVTESYTSQYVVGLPQKSKEKVEPITESVGFKERFMPKTSEQLAELRNYGL